MVSAIFLVVVSVNKMAELALILPAGGSGW